MSDAAAPSPHPLLRRRWLLPAALAVLLILAFLLPSQLGIHRYQRSIASIMARSLGRPVHLSGVDWRLLPTPAFILHDLTVSEDSSFGAEPLLTARTVIASVSLYSLWRGHPVFSSIHVDQASLNLVRNDAGRWNLEALLGGPAQQHLAGSASSASIRELPYLEATESRINLKSGSEKSPYSLVNSDLSFWQDQPGHWRIRLRGQPIRTDIAQATDSGQDAGEIRVEGSLQSAPALRQMPVHLQLAWRNAQLGQLSLLLLGDDAGWRGNLTADLALTGTAEQASIQGRLSATGVHRAELGPVAPLDFDSNCGLTYQHTLRAIHQLHCDTSIGDGHLLYAAEVPAEPASQSVQQTITLQRIPLQATLDLLRTLRSGIAPGLSAAGTLDGALRLQPPAPAARSTHAAARPRHAANTPAPVWSGAITLTGGQLRGDGLAQPWTLARLTLQPDPSGTLATTVPLPVCAGKSPAPGSTDCAAALSLTRSGYQIRLRGNASLPRLLSFSRALGLSLPFLAGFHDGAAEMQMQAAGAWLHSAATSDQLTGSLHLRDAHWSHPSLAQPVLFPDATLSLDRDSLSLHGSASIGNQLRAQLNFTQPISSQPNPAQPASAATPAELPSLDLTFDRLDAAVLQSALAPADTHTGLLAALASRVHPEAPSPLPPLRLTASAAACTLDRLALTRCSASLHRAAADPPRAFTLDRFHAAFAGGSLTATGTLDAADTQSLRLRLVAEDLQPAPLAALVAAHWTGGTLSGTADLTTQSASSAASAAQWIAAATGTLQFDWKHGNLGPTAAPAFDRWTGSATLANRRLTLGANTLIHRGKTTSLTGFIPWGGPPRLATRQPVPQP